MMMGMDNDTVILIPDFMGKTRLGSGPLHSSNMSHQHEVPVFGCTFIYMEGGELQRSYAVIPTDYASKIWYVSIQYLKKVLTIEKFKNIVNQRSKLYVTFEIFFS